MGSIHLDLDTGRVVEVLAYKEGLYWRCRDILTSEEITVHNRHVDPSSSLSEMEILAWVAKEPSNE